MKKLPISKSSISWKASARSTEMIVKETALEGVKRCTVVLDTIAAGYVVTARYGPDDARAAYAPEAWIDLMVDALLDGIAEPPAGRP